MSAIDPNLRFSVARKRKDVFEVASPSDKVLAPRSDNIEDYLPSSAPPARPHAEAKPKSRSKKAGKGLSVPAGGGGKG